MDYPIVIKTPFGKFGIKTDQEMLISTAFLPAHTPSLSARDPFSRFVVEQFRGYFADPAFTMDIPMACQGTKFQQKVWQKMRRLRSGETRQYGQLAQELHSSARAVGNACRQNPLPVIVPCHRIVSKQNIGGFSGQTQGEFVRIKIWLLNHEQARASWH